MVIDHLVSEGNSEYFEKGFHSQSSLGFIENCQKKKTKSGPKPNKHSTKNFLINMGQNNHTIEKII